ncbi:MAG: hypothetical protein AABX17_01155 [Nanoarchaeota archaeon]
MVALGVIFLATILIGIIATVLAYYANKYSLDELKKSLKLRLYAIALICFGFIVHTAGDYYGHLYGSENLELTIESIAHIIIFISIIICLLSTKKIMEISKEYKFK